MTDRCSSCYLRAKTMKSFSLDWSRPPTVFFRHIYAFDQLMECRVTHCRKCANDNEKREENDSHSRFLMFDQIEKKNQCCQGVRSCREDINCEKTREREKQTRSNIEIFVSRTNQNSFYCSLMIKRKITERNDRIFIHSLTD